MTKLTPEDQMVANSIKLMLPDLTKELKAEWHNCVKFCAARRKSNFDNRTVTSQGAKQGYTKSGSHQEHLRIPRLVEFQMDKHFGLGWRTDRELTHVAYRWACKNYPQFRLVEGHECR